jgi:hypothetical protein
MLEDDFAAGDGDGFSEWEMLGAAGITEQTYCRWRKKYGGWKLTDALNRPR